MSAVSCIVYMLIIFYGKFCLVMTDTKKERKLSESNFGHKADAWGTEKKASERTVCDTKERKKKLDSQRIVAYKLNNEE